MLKTIQSGLARQAVLQRLLPSDRDSAVLHRDLKKMMEARKSFCQPHAQESALAQSKHSSNLNFSAFITVLGKSLSAGTKPDNSITNIGNSQLLSAFGTTRLQFLSFDHCFGLLAAKLAKPAHHHRRRKFSAFISFLTRQPIAPLAPGNLTVLIKLLPWAPTVAISHFLSMFWSRDAPPVTISQLLSMFWVRHQWLLAQSGIPALSAMEVRLT
jgi:hypothetical protein